MIRFINSFIVIVLLTGSLTLSQELRFIKEDITFKLNKGYFSVEGFYWFKNLTNHRIEKKIYYPFGSTNEKDQIDSVQVFNFTDGSAGDILNRNDKGFDFLLISASYDTVLYRICYRQKINCDSVRYILQSTQIWNDALESAEYKLIVSEQVVVTGYSYLPDKVYTIQDKKIYYWKRKDFLPERDLIFHFQIK